MTKMPQNIYSQTIPFVVVTPAFNEEKHISRTIISMIRQTIKPIIWVIVDDGSTDKTSKIVQDTANNHDWIKYLYNKKQDGVTYYASNVYAIQKGIELVKTLPYDFLAILDADIELCDDYYELILEKLLKHQDLGIAAGTFVEKAGNAWEKAKRDRRATPKGIQVFRRECYETIGGYIPFKYGGEDSGTEITARMKGWKTWSFDNIIVKHHRPVGTGISSSILKARFRTGIADYCLGTHPLFMVLKSIKRMVWEKPYFTSGIARLVGYLIGRINKYEKQLPLQTIKYLRREQIQRIFKPHIYDLTK